ncbi:S8/S53 family peptidase [Sphingomonas sp. LM7]|uniref:S8/S53 family peptidase n=1 Tax=Sphingomonas sp. LM7 TaxID=1938607 RepID=UPI000983BCE1|nr:S8/S53 family peptidase [Sphingomonas sp. LM7]AQR75591.1 hypothetical protein BXU08_00700 [Sphingomonas sp. LM7]
MQLPVFVELPSQHGLRRSAAAAFANRRSRALRSVRLPAAITIDPRFPAIPSGAVGAGSSSVEALQVEASDRFLVRGFVDVEDLSRVPDRVGGLAIYSDPQIGPLLTCPGRPPVGDTDQIAAKLNLKALRDRGLDGSNVAIAILDGGTNLPHLQARLAEVGFDAANSWTPLGLAGHAGAFPVDHGTACAYDALIAAPKATLLDFPILAGDLRRGRTLYRGFLAYAQLIASWAILFAPGDLPKYSGLVVSNSWGVHHPRLDFSKGHPGRYVDNPEHPFLRQLALLSKCGADIVFAAGNCGAGCASAYCEGRSKGSIMGANASGDVLTVGACDTDDMRLRYSSQGPSIAGLTPQKPDVLSYAHFRGSEVTGVDTPDAGTSAACPVAAGCIAALRSRISPAKIPPAELVARIRATARAGTRSRGWNADYGFGILDLDALAISCGV